MKEINLQPNERIIREGYAVNYLGIIGHSGRLFLTNQRLYFTTHPLNFKQYNLTILLSEIDTVILKNNLKIFSHGLRIQKKNGHRIRLTVWRRKKWRKQIMNNLA